ncbi:FkbM family methyltransferase [Helicobacter muridarum]|nr:FkbM family methyltransferase [Helicobacter muridarum]STQ85569.1 methyltransferase, FkbM family [Helicobacter muridarum]
MNIYPISHNAKAKTFCEDFLSYPSRRYVFGVNDYALSIAYALDYNIAGFICDYDVKSPLPNISVIKTSLVPSDALIVSCVVLSQALNVRDRLNLLGFRNLDYFAFAKYSNLNIKDIEFVSCKNEVPLLLEDSKLDIEHNISCYEAIYDLLADALSKNAFEKCLNFRYSSNIEYMQGFSYTPETQYFEDFIPFCDIDIFIDIGAYHGETTLAFLQRNNKAICHCFEPESTNFTSLQQNLNSFDNVHLHKYGLGNLPQSLYISKENGSANRIIRQDRDNSLNVHIEKVDIVNLDSMYDLLFGVSSSVGLESSPENVGGGGKASYSTKLLNSTISIY